MIKYDNYSTGSTKNNSNPPIKKDMRVVEIRLEIKFVIAYVILLIHDPLLIFGIELPRHKFMMETPN